MITAAVDESTAALSATVSSRGTNCTSNGARGKPYHEFSAPQVTAAAAAVRPWKLCSSATIFGRPVTLSAIRSAFSFASAPLFTKNTRPTPGGANAASASAASSRILSGSAFVWNTRSRARARDRVGQPRVAVAERGHRVSAIEIEHASTLRVLEPHAGALHRRERQHRVHLVEMRVHRDHPVVHRDVHQSHPAAGAVNPMSSGSPSKRLAHWMLPPAAPLSRLSSTEQTTIVSPSASACSAE